MKKVNNSLAKKLRVSLLNICKYIFETYIVQYTIQRLNCVVRYLNVKIDLKLVDKINAQF